MYVSPPLLASALARGVCDRYYQLCAEYPLSASPDVKKVPYKEVLAAAGELPLTMLKGPGTVFSAGGMPQGTELDFIIQSGGTVETGFSLGADRTTFAILCNLAMAHAGRPAPSPGYPRPVCSSAQAMVAVFARIRELALELAENSPNAG